MNTIWIKPPFSNLLLIGIAGLYFCGGYLIGHKDGRTYGINECTEILITKASRLIKDKKIKNEEEKRNGEV
jgi:hypothetical protein